MGAIGPDTSVAFSKQVYRRSALETGRRWLYPFLRNAFRGSVQEHYLPLQESLCCSAVVQ